MLPQSPQLFKQLCMVGGLDRYFQIARCLRDEDLRADRQFEFMQLDLEMSFADQQDVLEATSRAIAAAVKAVTGEDIAARSRRMTWIDAQERFGSDKPDLRFGMELIELTDVFAGTEFNAFKAPCVKGIRVEGGAEFTRSRLDDLTDMAKRYGAKGLVWMRVTDDGVDSPVAKFLSARRDRPRSRPKPRPTRATCCCWSPTSGPRCATCSDCCGSNWVASRSPKAACTSPGSSTSRCSRASTTTVRPRRRAPPLHDAQPRRPRRSSRATHCVRAQSYDLVLNGWELGSGSVRIHRADIQQHVFDAVGIDPEDAQRRFGFLLDAFKYGAPPHAGFAFGLDRLVAILAGEENIREVIAFPKTQSGLDLLTGAPTPIEAAQLERVAPPSPSSPQLGRSVWVYSKGCWGTPGGGKDRA